MRAIDVCCGAGGLSLGLRDAGWSPYGVDLDGDAVASYRAQVAEAEIADLATWTPGAIRADLVAGGVPCQPHSEQGKKDGLASAAGRLHEHLLRVAREAHARAVLMENVPGIANGRRGEEAAIAAVARDFGAAGFEASVLHLDAADFGVPQHRPRVFIVGLRYAEDRVRWPSRAPVATHGPGLFTEPHVTVRAALKLTGDFLAGGRHLDVTWWQGSRRIDVDKPSWTIGTRNNADWICPVGGAAYRPRLADLATLQDFPPGFTFEGGETAQHRQMGNAVPRGLARARGRALRSTLFP